MLASAFVSRQFHMHPLEVREAAADWHQTLPVVTTNRRFARAEPRLWLAREPAAASADPNELYAVPGVLWMSGRPIRLRLEFTVWSSGVSEVGIAPARLRWPVQTDRYSFRVGAVVEDVIRSIYALADRRSVAVPVAPTASCTPGSWQPARVPAPRPARSVISVA